MLRGARTRRWMPAAGAAAVAAVAFGGAVAWSANDVVLVSRATGTSGAGGNKAAFFAAASTSGSRVAFVSRATNLTGDGVPGGTVGEAFVRNVSAGTILL